MPETNKKTCLGEYRAKGEDMSLINNTQRTRFKGRTFDNYVIDPSKCFSSGVQDGRHKHC